MRLVRVQDQYPWIYPGAELIHAVRNIYPDQLAKHKEKQMRKVFLMFKCKVIRWHEKTVEIEMTNRHGQTMRKRNAAPTTIKPIDWVPSAQDEMIL